MHDRGQGQDVCSRAAGRQRYWLRSHLLQGEVQGRTQDVLDLEELIEEIEQRLEEDLSYQLGDLFWRTDVLIEVIRSRPWGEELLRDHFGPQFGW